MTSEHFWNTVRLQYALEQQTPYICRIISAREIKVLLNDNDAIKEITEVTGERWDEEGLHLQFILMEQLETIIEKNRFGKVSLTRTELENEESVVNFAIQIGQALCFTHNNGALHRDIKLENVFWDNHDACYKLGDFGIAKLTESGNAETVVYTDGYGAPEIERRLYDKYNATADIYSMGITLYLLLNDFKFPGSEGYYVNMVQYNPEFVFPAPVRASEKLTKIIRKMCQYYQEERYQSMEEVLMDLRAYKVQVGETYKAEELFLDVETETYRDSKIIKDTMVLGIRKTELTGREKRKYDEKVNHTVYMDSSTWYFIGFTILCTLLLGGLQEGTDMIKDWQFWMLTAAVFIESVLLGMKEFYILFGGIALAIGVYTCISVGVTIPHILLISGLIISIPVVTGACAVSTVLWAILNILEHTQWFEMIRKNDISWILWIIIFIMLNRYMMLRIELNKISYARTTVGIFISDKMYLVMLGAGLILFLMEFIGLIQIPEIVRSLHLIRSGGILFIWWVIYLNWCRCTEE